MSDYRTDPSKDLKKPVFCMKYRLRIRQVCIGCMLIDTSLVAQKETFVPANDVSFTISIERNSYGDREQITVKYQIVNISNGPLYVPRAWEAKCPANPHVWAWFENSAGKHFRPGYGGSCIPSSVPQTVTGRMSKEAVLLKPGEHLDGSLQLDPTLFGGLPPGAYRIEAVLYCWKDGEFTGAERMELEKLGSPFLYGEVPASARVTLTP
jgi:hypothetical protein